MEEPQLLRSTLYPMPVGHCLKREEAILHMLDSEWYLRKTGSRVAPTTWRYSYKQYTPFLQQECSHVIIRQCITMGKRFTGRRRSSCCSILISVITLMMCEWKECSFRGCVRLVGWLVYRLVVCRGHIGTCSTNPKCSIYTDKHLYFGTCILIICTFK